MQACSTATSTTSMSASKTPQQSRATRCRARIARAGGVVVSENPRARRVLRNEGLLLPPLTRSWARAGCFPHHGGASFGTGVSQRRLLHSINTTRAVYARA